MVKMIEAKNERDWKTSKGFKTWLHKLGVGFKAEIDQEGLRKVENLPNETMSLRMMGR